jgi:hypothetical protein
MLRENSQTAMFERIKNAMGLRPPPEPVDDPVSRWATGHFLRYRRRATHPFDVSGLLLERPFRAECAESSRAFIQGLEMRARWDLGLPPAGHVIVMSRVVRQALEKQSNTLYEAAGNTEDARKNPLPEEVRWLSLFRQGIWTGPQPQFWERYAVLSDSAELARNWLDQDAVDFLLAGNSEASASVPLLVSLMKGKCYLRLQINPHAEGADALLALEMLEHLGARALQLAGRPQPSASLNNPG